MSGTTLYDTAILATRYAGNLAWKATLLFAITGLLLLLLRRHSAAARHLVGTAGLAAALLLPFLILWPAKLPLPALSVFRMLPSPKGTGARFAVALWLVGTLAVAVRLFVGWLRVGRIARAAMPVRDADWIQERDALALRLSVTRRVEMKESPAVPAAMTAGVLRPLLLIGRAARQWAVERRRVVLLHELAHVKRLDWISVMIAEVAVAVYWFHPLAWWLGRRVRRDAERASDDLVLASGVKPSVYAGHLLGIFRSLGAPAHPVAPALAAVRPSHFEERLRAILNPSSPRRGRTTAAPRLAAAGLLAGAVGIGAVGSWNSPCHGSPAKPKTAAAAAATVAAPAPLSAPATTHSHSCPLRAIASAAPAGDARPGTAAADGSSESDEAEAAVAENLGDAVETPAPDVVVRAVRLDPPTVRVGFVKASNGHKGHGRDGGDWYSRGMGYHRDEQYENAIAAFRKSIDAGYREDAASYNIACGFARLGNENEAFEWLERALDAGFDQPDLFRTDEDLDNLRGDPRFRRALDIARAGEATEAGGESD